MIEIESSRREYRKNSIWSMLVNSNFISLISLAFMLFVGIVFYKTYDEMTWSEAYYYSVSQGLRIGYTVPKTDKDDFSKVFTLTFKFVGICILAVFYTNLLRASYFQRTRVRKTRLYIVLSVCVLLMIIGIIWSYYTVDWSFFNSVYFVFSTYFFWGIYSLPDDPSSSEMSSTASLAFFGGITVYALIAMWSCDVEKWIEKYLLRQAANKSFSAAELGTVQRLNNLHSNSTMRLQANVQLMGVEAPSSVVEGSTDDVLSDNLLKKLLLLRILSLEDVSYVYRYLRYSLVLVFALMFMLGSLFYQYYDNSDYVSLALNYSLSSMYRLGYSNDDKDEFSQFMSIVFMLVGCVLLNVLIVTVTREYSLKSNEVRYLNIGIDAVLCVVLVVLSTLLFMYGYDWTYMDSSTFAINIMIGYGGDVPSGEEPWTYWLLDFYTIVSLPLFTALVSHLEVELDMGDSLGYLTDALNNSFSKDDMALVEVFEDFHNHIYSNLDSQSKNSRHNNNVYGMYELHVLLVLRLKDMNVSDLNSMLNTTRSQYKAALAGGTVPAVYDSSADHSNNDESEDNPLIKTKNLISLL